MSLALVALLLAVMVASPVQAAPDPIILSNGPVQIGVRPLGDLNAPGDVPSVGPCDAALGTCTTTVGLRYLNLESLADNCECEGWGISYWDGTGFVHGSAQSGWAIPTSGLDLINFAGDEETNPTEVTSVVKMGDLLVTHHFTPGIGVVATNVVPSQTVPNQVPAPAGTPCVVNGRSLSYPVGVDLPVDSRVACWDLLCTLEGDDIYGPVGNMSLPADTPVTCWDTDPIDAPDNFFNVWYYRIDVTVENTGDAQVQDIRYRRVADWDIEPTPAREDVQLVDPVFITDPIAGIQHPWPEPELRCSGVYPFFSADPTVPFDELGVGISAGYASGTGVGTTPYSVAPGTAGCFDVFSNAATNKDAGHILEVTSRPINTPGTAAFGRPDPNVFFPPVLTAAPWVCVTNDHVPYPYFPVEEFVPFGSKTRTCADAHQEEYEPPFGILDPRAKWKFELYYAAAMQPGAVGAFFDGIGSRHYSVADMGDPYDAQNIAGQHIGTVNSVINIINGELAGLGLGPVPVCPPPGALAILCPPALPVPLPVPIPTPVPPALPPPVPPYPVALPGIVVPPANAIPLPNVPGIPEQNPAQFGLAYLFRACFVPVDSPPGGGPPPINPDCCLKDCEEEPVEGLKAKFEIVVDPACNDLIPPPVHFFDLSTSSPNPIDHWSWEFGDGSPSSDTPPNPNDPVHQYEEPGLYYATLTVRDSAGNVASFTIAIDVRIRECDDPATGQPGERQGQPRSPQDGALEELDTDEDGWPDSIDNCPRVFQTDQDVDLDLDGIGDPCDDDIDGDGVRNADDNCVILHNPAQRDLDTDGQGDACDKDIDGDRVLNVRDNCVYVPNGPDEDPVTEFGGQLNTDGDAAGDACDTDRDGDGVDNELDCFPDDILRVCPEGVQVERSSGARPNSGVVVGAERFLTAAGFGLLLAVVLTLLLLAVVLARRRRDDE